MADLSELSAADEPVFGGKASGLAQLVGAGARVPPGFAKIMEGYRRLRGKPDPVAHLVYSDGLVAISVFVEPLPPATTGTGLSQQGGLNIYSVKVDDYLVTALGEAPGATVRQTATSVVHR